MLLYAAVKASLACAAEVFDATGSVELSVMCIVPITIPGPLVMFEAVEPCTTVLLVVLKPVTDTPAQRPRSPVILVVPVLVTVVPARTA